jgi:hypothetical protein
MKLRSLLTLSALSLGLVSAANAVTTNTVYLTGSTAFRGAIFITMTNTVNGVFDPGSNVVYVAGKCSPIGTLNPQTGGQMEFFSYINATPTIVKCAWSGSEAGIADVVNGTTESFIDSALINSAPNSAVTTTYPTPDPHPVDLAMSDTDQSVSLTQNPPLNNGQQVGIIPFVFVKNAQTNATTITAVPGDWANITNVTDPQLRVMLSGGSPAGLLTGNNADTKWVYIAGRDNQSGTFDNTMLGTQFGLVASPRQIKVAGQGPSSDYASQNPTNLVSGNGANVAGQNSGGTLSTTMTLVGSSTNIDWVQTRNNHAATFGWYAIAYLGLPDADVCLGIQGPVVAPAGTAAKLTYNGVAESPNNISNGTYSFWGNEWLYGANTLSSAATSVFNNLGNNIAVNCDNDHFLSLTFMNSTKTTSASDPTHN